MPEVDTPEWLHFVIKRNNAYDDNYITYTKLEYCSLFGIIYLAEEVSSESTNIKW
jgi:hypothetical protein